MFISPGFRRDGVLTGASIIAPMTEAGKIAKKDVDCQRLTSYKLRRRK